MTASKTEQTLDGFRDRHVVVTGGTGALGTAVADALVKAGAICHVPYVDAAEAERFSLRGHAQVKLVPVTDLADEASVARLFGGVPALWASIHLAGGFAMKPVAETTRADLMQQVDMNFVTAFLCCRAAVNAMARTGAGGRIVNVAARPALEWRSGAGMVGLHREQGRGRGAHRRAGGGGREGRHPGQRGRALDHGHAGQPRGHAEGRSRRLAEGRGGRGDDPVPGVARQQGHARRDRAGVREES